MKIKIFEGNNLELQKKINAWMEKHKDLIIIKDKLQNSIFYKKSTITIISIWYEQK